MTPIKWIEAILCFVAVVVGIFSSITDLRSGKIYNKVILLAIIIGLPLNVYYYGFLVSDFLWVYCCNLGITIILGFLFFKFKLWAAGDGKLWIIFVFLLPVSLYMVSDHNLFPAAYLLSFSFSLAFFYLCIDSLVKTFQKQNEHRKSTSVHKWNWSSMLVFLDGYLFILLLNLVLSHFFEEFIHENQALYVMVVFLLMLSANKVNLQKKQRILLLLVFTAGVSAYLALNKMSFLSIFNWKYLILMFAVIALKDWAARYNYDEIEVEQIHNGMVLSLSSVMKFRISRVQGLPQFTDETTRFRLTKEQVESIQRWRQSKQGEPTLTVVRQIPFGSFLFLGTATFVLIRWCFIN